MKRWGVLKTAVSRNRLLDKLHRATLKSNTTGDVKESEEFKDTIESLKTSVFLPLDRKLSFFISIANVS